MSFGIEAAEFGLSLLGKDGAEQRQRLEDFPDFCQFSARDCRDQLMAWWNEYREKRRRS